MFSACLAAAPSTAAFEEYQTDARSFAMGGAWAALDLDDPAGQANPAALAFGPPYSASAGFCLPFGMADLAAVSSLVRAELKGLGLGLALCTMGSQLYRESAFGASGAWRYRDAISAGLSLNGYHLSVQGYGSAMAVGLDAGFMGRPAKQLALGLAARNLNRPGIGDPTQELSQELSAGLALIPSDRATTALHLQAQKGWPVQVRVGQEFRIWKGIAARAGYSTNPASVSGGAGLGLGSYSFGYAVRSHPELGLSHCLTLSFSAGRAREPVETPKPPDRKVALNAATASELEMLPGLGRKQAEAVIACRDSLAAFDCLDDLLAVRGVTRRTLERLAPFVDLGFRDKGPEEEYPLDINTASLEALSKLPGIGPVTASSIGEHRREHGPFRSVDELLKVKGIGRRVLERIRELVAVRGTAEAE